MRRIIMLIALAGCSSVPAMTAARLVAVDPLTADPGQIELAVVLPPGISPQPGSAKLTLHAAGGGQVLDAGYALVARAAARDVPLPAGARALAYGLSPSDAVRMRELQAEVAGWRASGERGQVALGVGLGGCRLGAGPAPDAEGAVYIRLADGGGFLPLVGPAPLSDMLGSAALAGLPPCGAPR